MLSRDDLVDKIFDEDPSNRLYVVPMLDKDQIGHGTVDIRLGTEFILSKKTNYAVLDPGDGINNEEQRSFSDKVQQYQDQTYVPMGGSLTLHPGQFVLGSSFEYLRLPSDLGAYVIGRSSWGRMGLVIATAIMVHPGFTGCLTLELKNVGETPIELYPGTRIAQLGFHPSQAEGSEQLSSKYSGMTGPGRTKVEEDPDWKMLNRIAHEEE